MQIELFVDGADDIQLNSLDIYQLSSAQFRVHLESSEEGNIWEKP